MSDEPVIYGLTDASGQIVYVGQTMRWNHRFLDHQRRFSDVVDLVILQNKLADGTADEAERAWIKRLAADGSPLRNVVHNSAEREPVKRLTIDISESLHRRVKIGCASRGLEMAEVMRELLEKEFPE